MLLERGVPQTKKLENVQVIEMSFCRSPQRHSFGYMHYVSLKTGDDMEDLPNLFNHGTLLGTHRTYTQDKTKTLWQYWLALEMERARYL